MTRTALALSPHLDDAVFSAGGTLAALASQGWRVIVATVFTLSVPDPRGFALACQLDKGLSADIDYMALRRQEDAAACAVLSAEPRWLPYPEAPHRGYRSAEDLFAGMHDGDDIKDVIAPALEALLDRMRPALLLAPQAIGGHVDHVVLVRAIDAVKPDVPTLWWYDYPYVERDADPAQPFADRFQPLHDLQITLKEADADAKLKAALAYRSQLGFQFGGAASLEQRLRAAGRTERFRSAHDLTISPA